MTRISRKILTLILSAIAFLSLTFGIVLTVPHTKTAKAADTAVTFSAAHLGDASQDPYGTSIRFDTTGLQWETYHNWVAASDWASIANYTTVNGRTVTEINNATTHTQKITLMMQPADSFSFLRLYIPAEIIPLGEVKAMGILDGWSFNNGTNNYTSSAVSFFRTGDNMLEESAYLAAGKTGFDSSNVTIGDASLSHRVSDHSDRGADSYVVDINIGQTIGEYDAMYSAYKNLRNAIYINGKSIEEWNAQKIAEDARFNDPSTYTYFPQNSTDSSHKDYFVKPVGLWGTSTGFRLSIFQELVADCEEIVVTVGEGAYVSGNFMVVEKISKTVWTQSVVDITDKLTFLDNSHNSPASWGATNMYYIHTNNEACWTQAPKGGCLNESDPSGVYGGQIQMKYVTFNGSTLWDINKGDDGAYESTQDNIASGGVYAPILVTMSSELGSSLKLTVPTAYTNGKAGHEEIVIKKGFCIYENGVSYYVTNDVVFTNNNGTWTKEIKGIEKATEVTGIVTKANRTDGGNNENFVIFQLSNNDYAGLNTVAITDFSSLLGYIDIGGNVVSATPTEPYFNVWNIQDSVAFRAPGLDVTALQNVEYITIKAGAKFPSYNTQYNDQILTYYVTSEDVTFVHDVPNDTWTVGEASSAPSEVDITNELSFYRQSQQYDGTETYIMYVEGQYWTKTPQGGCLNEYDPESAGGGQEQMKYLYLNGTSLYDINKNDDGSYGSAQGNIASGGVYAPILVQMGVDDGNSRSYIQIHIPTEYPNAGATANQNHQNFEIKAGFTVTEGTTTWKVTQDIKWLNLNGTWVKESATFAGSDVTIDNPRVEGNANELYKVDITSTAWTIDCNDYDFMYGNAYATYRQYIYINGVSVYDINVNTDDSSYVYSTFPMTGADDATFAHPVLIQTHNQASDPNTITLWIHKDYMKSLGDSVTVTLGAGYNAFTNGLSLAENVSYDMIANVTVNDGSRTVTSKIVKGTTIQSLYGTPTKEMTETAIYTFDNWYITGTDTVYDATKPITEDISVEARFTEDTVNLIETEVDSIQYVISATDNTDRWLVFRLTTHDYDAADALTNVSFEELERIGFANTITIYGTMTVGGVSAGSATLSEIFSANGHGEAIYINIWDKESWNGTIAVRLPEVESIDKIVVDSATMFPSYSYLAGETSADTRLMVELGNTYTNNGSNFLIGESHAAVDIQMADGASVRVSAAATTDESGIRFQTFVLQDDVAALETAVSEGKYKSFSFGTLIVPTDYLMGGQFNHEWLENNYGESGEGYLDIPNSGWYANPQVSKEGYYTYYGSIVNLDTTNYDRYFSGVGYVKITHADDTVEYIYAPYSSANNSRSASFVANAAIADRSVTQDDVYQYLTSNNNYSPYTQAGLTFLETYLAKDKTSLVDSADLDALANRGGTYTMDVGKSLAGAYVTLTYTTNVNVWGVFNYTDGSKTAAEDFYLQAGTTQHKQYLDIFRYNGVGYEMDTNNLTLTSITFTNAELSTGKTTGGSVKIYNLYSEAKTINASAQEIYVTVAQKDGSSMTVGAHLGIGGALTYLAKSGVYEGVIGGSSGWKDGTVAISTDSSVFDSTNVYKSGSSSSSTSTETGFYGHATSSLPSDGAVNLINNFDAGRQIQQSWYANVGGDSTATAGENGYTRAYCYTGSTAGQYWPYNPVQAGDVVSNPGQIIDYEVNEAKGYIYVKARAMDWAKGYNAASPCENAVVGGVTTKSYVENYYRLGTDGTLIVNNGFVDWNGFTDMESCAWTSTELPAVYPVHTLNYYVSNTDGDGSWTDDIEYNNGLTAWTGGTAYHQFTNPLQGDTKVEDWFAWANGGNGDAFGMGMYIPNVNRYTSGRSYNSTAYYTDTNFQNSNALPVDEYTEWSWSSFSNVSMVTEFAQRGNILADKGMLSNMQPIKYTYQSAYVSNTSYTAPGIDYRMEAYKSIEYSYVICLDTVTNIRNTFKGIKDTGKVTNAGNGYEKVGLDAWARADKAWTW